ncbi:MAG: alpha-hydroxy acid oxidase [Acidimicrobiales bacterium]
MKRAAVNLEEIARRARRRLPRLVVDFVEGGAEDEATLRANREAFARWALVPRVLVDVAERNLATCVLGQDLSMPIGLGPAGLARVAHHEGEVAAARAAGEAGTVFTLSTGSSRTIEEVADASNGPVWFQLYLWRDREVIEGLVKRAAAAKYAALVLTVDVPVIGQRERDLRNGFTLPPRLTPQNAFDMIRRPRWLAGLVRGTPLTFANFVDVPGRGRSAVELGKYVNVEMMNPGATWETFEWLRRIWHGPLAMKGVLHPHDAARAVELGADGVVVSNHGGRQLDSAVAALDALPAIADAVAGRADVLFDSGVRRGTDVVKALALGAKAVLIGRPYVLGLGADGAAGVSAVLDVLRRELDRALALIGCADASELTRDFVTRVGEPYI